MDPISRFCMCELQVVQHTMALLCALAQLEPGLSEVIVSSPCLGSALSFSLLRTPELLVRKKVAEGVMNMAQIKIDKPSQVCPTLVRSSIVSMDTSRVEPYPCIVSCHDEGWIVSGRTFSKLGVSSGTLVPPGTIL